MSDAHSWDAASFKQLWRHGAELQHRVEELLAAHPIADDKFFAAVEALQVELGDAIHAELFFHLCRQKYSPQRATQHWRDLRALHESMSARLGEPLDIRATLVSYLIHHRENGGDPMVIDVARFDELHDILLVDELTGLHNVRYLHNMLEHELRRAEQWGYTASMLVINIDDFAVYNRLHGFAAANDLLVQLARIIRNTLRPSDLAVRYGGDEFVLMFPATSKSTAQELALRFQQRLHTTAFPHGRTQPLGELTVSIGIAAYPADAKSGFELLRRADSAKYAAKKGGKNRTLLYGDNRRSHGRVSALLSGQLSVASEGAGLRFRTRDISEAGLLVVTDNPLPAEALLDIRLTLQDGEPPVSCPARVVRSEVLGDGSYQAGVHFIAPGTEDHQRLVRYIARKRKGRG